MKRWLDEEVYRYTGGDAYPFHIPGAKRINVGLGTPNLLGGAEETAGYNAFRTETAAKAGWNDPFRYDITEIGGFDDLRHASGLLAELEREWAKMYGAGAAFLLVNGSTCGNLAAIFAATKQHDRILVADGCHWSVCNAAELRELSVGWLSVERSAEGFCEAVTADAVERGFAERWESGADVLDDGHRAIASKAIGRDGAAELNELDMALAKHSETKAVVITSPTYEGLVADVPQIAEIVHSHGAVLLVDAAHGAHLGLRPWDEQSEKTADVHVKMAASAGTDAECHKMKTQDEQTDISAGRMADRLSSLQNPITQGADAAVVSLHKTLPVLGQVSLILLPKSAQPRLRADEVKRYLNMFQTSSPSYLLMSSAAAGCRFLQERGARRYREYARLLADFYEKTSGLKALHILGRDNQDLSKIIISTKDAGLSGQELMERLRADYHLELEKAGERYALAVTSVMDTGEGFRRLADALYEIDGRFADRKVAGN